MERGRRHISPRARVPGALDNRSSGFVARIGYHAIPVAGMTGITNHIERSAGITGRRVTGIAAELTVRAVPVESCARGESYTAVVLFDDVTALNVSDNFAHNLDLFVVSLFLQLRSVALDHFSIRASSSLLQKHGSSKNRPKGPGRINTRR